MKRLTFFLLLAFLMVSCQNNTDEKRKPIRFNLPEGFVLEDLYSPNEEGNDMGSWVALTEGPNQTYYACDQRGDIYQFKMPEEGAVLKRSDIDSVDLEIGHAHGLLWAFNSLYVAVNKSWREENPDEEERGSGIYRLKDTNGDGQLDHIEILLKLDGAGEHGPHNFAVGPGGKDLYFLAGNHVTIPDIVKQNSRLPNNWGEDNVFTPYLDARGHANEIKAPGGWIVRTDPEGKEWELVSAGYRNPFDLSFNTDGELFTYDADMEWDIGMPWYRPTRVCHVTSGSEYGWRTGSGKWPDYYPDNLPAVINLEQGSPTGILMGTNLNVPARYKNGLFIMDWSFGTIYFIDLQAKGSTYTGTKKEFLSGTPLPLTDMIAGSDGNLYFATGGRGLESHLYRLTYKGDDSVESNTMPNKEVQDLRQLRKNIEAFHNHQSPNAIPMAWNYLDHPDRFIRYAARIAIEHQPVDQWIQRFNTETSIDKLILAGTALARQGSINNRSSIINKLKQLDFTTLSETQKINLLRTYNLLNIRMGLPEDSERKSIIAQFSAHFPAPNDKINRELSQLLQFLKAEESTSRIVTLLEKHTREKTANADIMLSEDITLRSEQYGPLIREVMEKMPPSEAIFYGVLLSHASEGWTDELRSRYFQWFYDVMSARGGLSFKPFMENVRLKAMSHVPESQKKKFEELSGVYSPMEVLEDLPEPIGPGKEYKASEINRAVYSGLQNYQGNIAAGKRAFDAALCSACHRMKGEGGNTGPDLSQIYTKFNRYDLSFALYSPNDEISDQYAFTLFHLKDGKKMAGKIVSESDDQVTILPNPYTTTYSVNLSKSDISKRELSPVSPMPPGLLNRLNEEEIVDLFAFLMSGADEKHEIYQ